MRIDRIPGAVALLALPGCMLSSYEASLDQAAPVEAAPMAPGADMEMEMADDGVGARGEGYGGGGLARQKSKEESKEASGILDMKGGKRADNAAAPPDEAFAALIGGKPGGGGGNETAVREWFPEAFLWRPLVETNDDGLASLDVKVPDQLTTWRVLALAHDRSGHQTGTAHTFDSTLPAYVDPVVPGWMYVGDRLALPVQVVNNTAQPLIADLDVVTDGELSGSTTASLAIGPFGSAVRTVDVLGEGAGAAEIQAELADVDAVKRTWTVNPVGRPVLTQRGGILTGRRELSITWPERTDPRTARLVVEVYPGPLAVLSSELERIGAGGRAPGAYAYGLATQLDALATAAGVELDAEALRALKIRAWQRLVRAARAPDAEDAADLLLSLQGAEGGPLLENLSQRLIRTVVEGQRGDGTWARQDLDTLQRVLVQTAVCMRALPETETGALLRAEGALERNLPNVDDPYTAAVMLATGRVANRELLLEKVMSGLVAVSGEDRKTVSIPSGVRSAWGGVPSRVEVLAWTALALQPDHPDVAGDLVAELMTSYSGATGFGSGQADALALEAVVRSLPTVSAPVKLTLSANGSAVAGGAVDPSQPRVPAILETGHPGDGAKLVLEADSASAGLSYVVTQHAWVPWTGTEGIAGVEVEISQGALRAGREGTLRFTIAAPSGRAVTVTQGLPPGVSVEETRLKGLAGVSSAEVDQDRFTFTTKAFGAGEVLDLEVPVTPTYAGQMVSRPLELEVSGRSEMLAPHRWVVAP